MKILRLYSFQLFATMKIYSLIYFTSNINSRSTPDKLMYLSSGRAEFDFHLCNPKILLELSKTSVAIHCDKVRFPKLKMLLPF